MSHIDFEVREADKRYFRDSWPRLRIPSARFTGSRVGPRTLVPAVNCWAIFTPSASRTHLTKVASKVSTRSQSPFPGFATSNQCLDLRAGNYLFAVDCLLNPDVSGLPLHLQHVRERVDVRVWNRHERAPVRRVARYYIRVDDKQPQVPKQPDSERVQTCVVRGKRAA
jgi:hypothetical protein